jgi:5'-3' exonuclease
MIALIDGDSFLSAAAWGRERWAALKHVETQINWVLTETFAEEYLIATGDPDPTNFRLSLHSEYKKSASRNSSRLRRPEWFGDLKWHLLAQPNVVRSVGCEADDLIRMWACQAEAAGDDFIVVSIDKDLDCIPGKHYCPKKKEAYEVSVDAADAFYWQQILQGDSVDNIPGLPGVGPARAKAILARCKTPAERKNAVIMAYQETFGNDWKHWMLLNGRLIHMWRHEHDYFTI